MFIGFIFWYRGLALGGIAAVGQLQLLQPFFGFVLAGLVLGEQITWGVVVPGAIVVACVAGARHFAKRSAASRAPGAIPDPVSG